MKRATRRLVLVSDLRRCRTGFVLAVLASRALTRSHVVHVDALRSVRAAFTIPEFAEIAVTSGLDSATLIRRFPCRFLLEWSKEPAHAA